MSTVYKKSIDIVSGVEKSQLIDVVSSTEIYIGTASAGALPSEPKWLIKKVSIVGVAISILMANGSSTEDQIWNNRGALTYV